MEGASEHEEVITGEFAHASMEFAIVYQASGLANYEERKYDPAAGEMESTGRTQRGLHCDGVVR